MNVAKASAGRRLGLDAAGTSPYVAGVCNIGPAEITRRRRFGHLGLAVTVVLLAALVAVHVPPLVRFVVALPAAGSGSGYLQAVLHFCAGFGSRGVFNFGDVGTVVEVEDPTARARDRARSTQIGLMSLAAGIVVGIVAVLLPL
jgi:hypothetical protein